MNERNLPRGGREDEQERTQVEQPMLRLGRMFAALSATNEAMLRAASPEELYQKVCDAAVHGGKLISATALLAMPGTAWMTVAASTGTMAEELHSRVSIDPELPEGRGLVGTAFRTRQPCASNDFLSDPRTRPWHALARSKDVAAGAALPFARGGKVSGVLVFHSAEKDSFDDEIVGLLTRMTENVSRALNNLESESERKRAAEALRQSETLFRSLVELSSDWYWEQDTDFRLIRVEGRRDAAGHGAKSAILGKCLWEFPGVVPDPAAFDRLRAMLAGHESFRDFEFSYRDPRGHFCYESVTGEPVFADDGRFIGYRGTSRDVTRRKRADSLTALEHAVTRSLAEADSSRKILQAVMRVVCESEQWETAGYFRVEDELGSTRLIEGWNGPGRQQAAVDYYKNTMNAVIPPGGLMSRVIQAARPLWVTDMNESHTTWRQRVDRTGERATFAFPVLADGKVIGVLAFASRSIREPDEPLLRTVRVIGEQVGQFLQRKQAQQVLRESEARFRALTDLSSDWYWETDGDFRFTRIEGRYVEGGESLPGENILGKQRWETGLEIEDKGGWDAHRGLLDTHQPYRDVAMYRLLPDGRRRYISVSGEPVHDHKGGFIGYRGVGKDITDRKIAENRIQHLASHDGLTLLPNRLMFGELLNLAMSSAQRHGHRLAVLFVDLDRFKLINDTLGHEAGDVLLKEFSLRLKDCLRSSDVVARLGGDEFVVLVPQVNEPNEAAMVARKILSAAAKPIRIFGQECRVTASIGISQYPADGEDEQSLMQNADIAMYLAKKEGKNNFQFYSEGARTQSS